MQEIQFPQQRRFPKPSHFNELHPFPSLYRYGPLPHEYVCCPFSSISVVTASSLVPILGQSFFVSAFSCPYSRCSISSRKALTFVSDPPLGCPTATCSWLCKVFRQISSCGLGEEGRQSFCTISVRVLSRRVTISH